ncbi:MAG: hypothetical protein H5T41_03660 [Methanomassiliicoccales archaeon]|jgi:hypothetical protein|nr:hypothetical protein [Methanomassiliicoccales archaeon]
MLQQEPGSMYEDEKGNLEEKRKSEGRFVPRAAAAAARINEKLQGNLERILADLHQNV